LIQRTPKRALRAWLWLPILVLLAVVAMVVNESTYQHTKATLTRGIDLTNAKLQAAGTLQILTDAESSARQYLMSRHADDLRAFKAAMAALPAAQAGMFGLITKGDPQGLVSLAELRALIAARTTALNSWMPAASAALAPLPSSESSRAQQQALRNAFDQVLQRAATVHDDLGGLLTAMKLEMARLRRVPDLPAAAVERMASIERRPNDGIALKRRIIENLRPSSLDQLGLCVALEMLSTEVSSKLGIPIVAHLEADPLNKDAELTIYRVVQESLTNISKYARASAVQVRLEAKGHQVRVTVKDDGKGFDVDRVGFGHHGLLGMHVRLEAHAGTLAVRSVVGEGTWVCADLPGQAQPQVLAAA
jgi:signal transduction histidine kinase